jgi:hypothetical protein
MEMRFWYVTAHERFAGRTQALAEHPKPSNRDGNRQGEVRALGRSRAVAASVTVYGGGCHTDRVRKASDMTLAPFRAAQAELCISLPVQHAGSVPHRPVDDRLCAVGRADEHDHAAPMPTMVA